MEIHTKKVNLDDLVLRAKNNDIHAVKELMNKYKPFILKKSSKYRIPGYEFEDLVQHCYLSIIKAIKKYNVGSSNFTSYVTNSINNNLNDLLRKNIKHYRELPDITNFNIETPDYVFTIEDEIIAFDEVKKLYEALDKLNEDERYFIENCYLKDKSLKSFAKEIGYSYSGLLKKRDRILKKLQKKL